MENRKTPPTAPENTDNSEKPSNVVIDIIIKTLATLAIGGLVMYSGLI